MANSSDTGARSEEVLAAAGIVVTPEGRARARERLRAAEKRWTPELAAELRDQIGLSARAA
ncbi:hypothetical protein [Micromonospora haikouensis]|uniref:hypothetical protein n=1 Tax=Micromonospora haikouensis TaxID=686309 RepID=UPI003D749B5A